MLFGGPEEKIRVDRSEYQDGAVAVDKLIGMPSGIVGRDRGGVLTNQLKDHLSTVVLLDEVEKAHPNVLNLFLQAFDEGWLTDGRGHVYLSDAIVIMTSNVGSEHFRKLTSPLGFLSAQIGADQDSNNRILLVVTIPASSIAAARFTSIANGRRGTTSSARWTGLVRRR